MSSIGRRVSGASAGAGAGLGAGARRAGAFFLGAFFAAGRVFFAARAGLLVRFFAAFFFIEPFLDFDRAFFFELVRRFLAMRAPPG